MVVFGFLLIISFVRYALGFDGGRSATRTWGRMILCPAPPDQGSRILNLGSHGAHGPPNCTFSFPPGPRAPWGPMGPRGARGPKAHGAPVPGRKIYNLEARGPHGLPMGPHMGPQIWNFLNLFLPKSAKFCASRMIWGLPSS